MKKKDTRELRVSFLVGRFVAILLIVVAKVETIVVEMLIHLWYGIAKHLFFRYFSSKNLEISKFTYGNYVFNN